MRGETGSKEVDLPRVPLPSRWRSCPSNQIPLVRRREVRAGSSVRFWSVVCKQLSAEPSRGERLLVGLALYKLIEKRVLLVVPPHTNNFSFCPADFSATFHCHFHSRYGWLSPSLKLAAGPGGRLSLCKPSAGVSDMQFRHYAAPPLIPAEARRKRSKARRESWKILKCWTEFPTFATWKTSTKKLCFACWKGRGGETIHPVGMLAAHLPCPVVRSIQEIRKESNLH